MSADLPGELEAELLARWREPHRRYHAESHLRQGLLTLDWLGAGRLERCAFWFHDAVHRCSSPADETASAELAHELLEPLFPAAEVEEVARLVLVTIDHDPSPGDLSGAMVSDADLAALGSGWEVYLANRDAVRAEQPDLPDDVWLAGRLRFLDRFERRVRVFHTPLGYSSWEAAARRNLARERALLTTRPATGRADA